MHSTYHISNFTLAPSTSNIFLAKSMPVHKKWKLLCMHKWWHLFLSDETFIAHFCYEGLQSVAWIGGDNYHEWYRKLCTLSPKQKTRMHWSWNWPATIAKFIHMKRETDAFPRN